MTEPSTPSFGQISEKLYFKFLDRNPNEAARFGLLLEGIEQVRLRDPEKHATCCAVIGMVFAREFPEEAPKMLSATQASIARKPRARVGNVERVREALARWRLKYGSRTHGRKAWLQNETNLGRRAVDTALSALNLESDPDG